MGTDQKSEIKDFFYIMQFIMYKRVCVCVTESAYTRRDNVYNNNNNNNNIIERGGGGGGRKDHTRRVLAVAAAAGSRPLGVCALGSPRPPSPPDGGHGRPPPTRRWAGAWACHFTPFTPPARTGGQRSAVAVAGRVPPPPPRARYPRPAGERRRQPSVPTVDAYAAATLLPVTSKRLRIAYLQQPRLPRTPSSSSTVVVPTSRRETTSHAPVHPSPNQIVFVNDLWSFFSCDTNNPNRRALRTPREETVTACAQLPTGGFLSVCIPPPNAAAKPGSR